MRVRAVLFFAVFSALVFGFATGVSAAPGPLIFSDQFSHGGSTSDPDWGILAGTMSLAGGQMHAGGTGTNLAIASPVTGFDQGTLAVKVTLASGGVQAPNASFVFGLLDENRYRYVTLRQGRIILGQQGNQALEAGGVKRSTPASLNLEKAMSLEITLRESGLAVVRVDGRRVLSYRFAGGQIPGRVGLRALGSPARFDDFLVRGPVSTGWWSRTYGWPEADAPLDAVATPDGGLVFAGSSFCSTDGWLARLDAFGEPRWEFKFSLSEAAEQLGAVRRTPDGGHVAAGYTTDAATGLKVLWVLRLDKSGSLLWQKSYPDGYAAQGYRLELAPGGGFFVAGWTEDLVSGVSLDHHVRVLRLGPDGTLLWDRTYGDGGLNRAYDLQALPDGGLVIAGATEERNITALGGRSAWLARLNADGGLLWQRSYDGGGWTIVRRILSAPGGGFFLAGDYSATRPPEFPVSLRPLLMRTDGEGLPLWKRTYDVDSSLDAVAPGPAGGLTLGGSLRDGVSLRSDIWTMDVDDRGIGTRAMTYGGLLEDELLSALVPAPGGGLWVVGSTQSFGAGWTNAWVLRLDASRETSLLTGRPSVASYPVTVTTTAGTLQPLGERAAEVVHTGGTRRVRSKSYRQAPDGTVPPTVQTGGGLTEGGGVGTAGGNVHGNGLQSRAWFEWGADARLETFAFTTPVAMAPAPHSQSFFASLSWPAPGALYYRVAAQNALGAQRGAIRRVPHDGAPPPTWARTFGTAAQGTGLFNDYASGLAATADGGLLLTGFSHNIGESDLGDLTLRRLDRHGNLLWHRTYGEAGWDLADGIIGTADGGSLLFGRRTELDPGMLDAWLLKLREDHQVEWQRIYRGGTESNFTDVLQTADGGYITLGQQERTAAIMKIDAGGGISWQEKLSGYSDCVLQTADGGYFVFGRAANPTSQDKEFWAVRLDAEGHRLWQRYYGVQARGTNTYEYDDYGLDAVASGDGGFYLVGGSRSFDNSPYHSFTDVLILRISAEGDLLWHRIFGNDGQSETAQYAVTDADGGLVVLGSAGIRRTDLLLLKVTPAGDLAWSLIYGGEGFEDAADLIRTGDGGFAVAGQTASFGAGGYDAIVLRTDQNGLVPGFGRDGRLALRAGTVVTTVSDAHPPEALAVTATETSVEPGSGRSFVDQLAP